MAAEEAVSPPSSLGDALRRFARLELVLGLFVVLSPLIMIAVDDWSVRGSISQYWDMSLAEDDQRFPRDLRNVAFYFPLTVAAVLFVVNGEVKRGTLNANRYNTVIGLLLAGVIIVNQQNFSFAHGVFAIAFFVVAVVSIFRYSYSEKGGQGFRRIKWLIGGAIVAVWAIKVIFSWDWLTVFWAEWIALSLIFAHYFLVVLSDIWPRVDYKAQPRGFRGKGTKLVLRRLRGGVTDPLDS